jgi:hypothetical protein
VALCFVPYTIQLQASLFSDYFGACPVVTVPGRTFPVQTHFIDHISKALGQGGRSSSSNSNSNSNTVSAIHRDAILCIHYEQAIVLSDTAAAAIILYQQRCWCANSFRLQK